jgi:hypothetical protein
VFLGADRRRFNLVIPEHDAVKELERESLDHVGTAKQDRSVEDFLVIYPVLLAFSPCSRNLFSISHDIVHVAASSVGP